MQHGSIKYNGPCCSTSDFRGPIVIYNKCALGCAHIRQVLDRKCCLEGFSCYEKQPLTEYYSQGITALYRSKSRLQDYNSANCLFHHLETVQRSRYPFHHGYTFRQCRPRQSLPWNPSRCLPYWKNSHNRCHDYEINLHTHIHTQVIAL